MRALALALTLVAGCGKPHEPVIQTIADCGDVVALVEVGGHLYAVTQNLFDPAARIQACAFDVDARGHLRVDHHEEDGFAAVVVEPDGTQTLAMRMPDEPLFVRLFRRDADGMRELDEFRVDSLAASPHGGFDLLPTAGGPALVARAHEWPPREGSGGSKLRAWRSLNPTTDPLDLALPKNAGLIHDAGTIIAIAIDVDDPEQPGLWGTTGSSFTVSVLAELAEGDEAVRWTRRVIEWNDSEQGSRLVDVASTGAHVFILAVKAETNVYWLACLGADDGELLWTAPVELGELNPWGGQAGMRAKNGGVVVAVFGYGSKWSTRVEAVDSRTWGARIVKEVIAVQVSAAGEQWIVGTRKIDVPQVGMVEPAADGRVWLAGSEDDDTWVTRVELR
jgi:hypothetical protein